jgi:hypothetical protein
MDCHGHGMAKHISISDLDALETVAFAKRNLSPYVSPILDTGTLALVCKDLGISGRAFPKVIKGRQYIAFSGYAGLRTLFPGTIYSAKNRRIITMAIGSLGIRNMVKTGGILTICITVPLTVLEAFLADHATCYDLAGELASDLIKVGVASVMGAAAGILAGGFTLVACAPIIVIIFVSGFTGAGLNWADEHFGLTEKLIAGLEAMSKEIGKTAGNTENFIYRGTKGFLRSQGIKIPHH